MSTDRIEHRLRELTRYLDALPETEEPPPTTLQVLGRSRKERYWQQLLVHFLSPEKAHGLGTDLLDHILSDLSADSPLDFSYSRLDLDDVEIAQEVTTGHGRPDIVIWVEEHWFLCIEIKVDASEGTDQTDRYVEADSFESIDLHKADIPREGHHYVYLAPAQASHPTAAEFTFLSWEWIASELQDFVATSYGDLPTRTTAQLNDFIDTIRSELTMTEYQETQRDKAKLYIEYLDDITELETAFNDQWAILSDNWGDRLAQTLETAEIRESSDAPDHFVVVDVTASATDRQRWLFRHGSDWALLRRETWWRSPDDLSTLYAVPDDESIAALGLFHRLQHNRELAVKDHVLELQFWHKNENADAFVTEFNQRLMEKEAEIREALPPAVRLPTITDTKRKLWTARYNIHPEEYDDFFDAYISALHDAFVDLVREHPVLLTKIDEAFNEAIGMYE